MYTEALGITDLWLFVAAGFLLNVTPGPDTAYIVARSAQFGRLGGVMAALGVCAGIFVHITAAAIGLSAILMTSALAFTALKWIGAAYLVYLGVRMLFARTPYQAAAQPRAQPKNSATLRMVFLQGMLTNVLNPKVALFFLAFMPQFIRPDAPSKVMAFVVLGLIFNTTGTLWNLAIAWGSARLSSLWGAAARAWVERAIGGVFIALGVRLALTER
jgi:threonine/homoserine/homoserine lactone efflux protein